MWNILIPSYQTTSIKNRKQPILKEVYDQASKAMKDNYKSSVITNHWALIIPMLWQ